MTYKERIIEILRVPIYPHELADPTEVVADYLLDNDVVPVVRCKDCIWFDLEDELPDVFRSEQYCYCTEANTYVPINHFCSFGERRTDD